MKRFYLGTLSAGMALAMMSVPPAMAQQQDHNNGGQQQNHNNGGQTQDHNYGSQMQGHNNDGQMQDHNYGGQMQDHNYGGPPQMGYDAQNQRHWRNGEHYDGEHQVVGNWDYYHLPQPPYGYEWVRDGDQFVLIAITSGIIAEIILNSLNH